VNEVVVKNQMIIRHKKPSGWCEILVVPFFFGISLKKRRIGASSISFPARFWFYPTHLSVLPVMAEQVQSFVGFSCTIAIPIAIKN